MNNPYVYYRNTHTETTFYFFIIAIYNRLVIKIYESISLTFAEISIFCEPVTYTSTEYLRQPFRVVKYPPSC